MALAALALNVRLRLRLRGDRLPARLADWPPYLGMGALNNLVPFSLIFWGQTRIGSGLAAILNATTPLFTVALAPVLAGERLTAGRLGGVLAGLAGVAVLVGPDALAGLGREALAQVAVLGAALSYAFAGYFGRRFRGQPPLVTATGQLTATTAMVLPVTLLVDRPWRGVAPTILTRGAMVGLGLLSTALAYVIYFRLLATAGVTNLLLVTSLIPMSALLLGTLVLGEPITGRHLGGMALIGLGLAFTARARPD